MRGQDVMGEDRFLVFSRGPQGICWAGGVGLVASVVALLIVDEKE